MRNTARASLLVVLSSLSGAACLTGRAATPAERPALEVPPPPPRVIAQLPTPEPPMPDPVEELPAGTKPASPVRPRPPAKEKEAAKPDPKPDTPPADPPPVQQPPQPAPQIRMPDTGDANTVSRQIRDIIERTRRALSQIDRNRQSAARQAAYDQAQLFAQQAEEALNAKNLVFAKELADKAERLTKDLQGR